MNSVFDFFGWVVLFRACSGVDWYLNVFLENWNEMRTVAERERELPYDRYFVDEVNEFDK